MKFCHITIKILLLILISSSAGLFTKHSLANTDTSARWFEIELIIFKSNRQTNFYEESWQKDITITKADESLELLPPESIIKNSQDNQPIKQVTSEVSPNIMSTSVVDIDQIEQEAKQQLEIKQRNNEKPFRLLNKSQLKLINDSQSLQRHPDYQVLTHIAWRQPVKNFRNAPHIHITGGQDFSESFNYDGRKLTDLNGQSTTRYFMNGGSIKNQNYDTGGIPVPELDGDIKIYLKKFLHIRTNLFLRKPGKDEVQAENLSMYDHESLSLNSELSSPDKNQQDLLNKPNQDHQFSWEIGDDFLETESQKLYVERLFNYQLKQARRVKSGELHYFDHPLLGLLISITPYKH